MTRLWCAICGQPLTPAARPCVCARGMAVPVQAPKKETSK